jgi:glucan phosphoethanolaminetransferase (alkaline phosphatase superfamily)
MCVCVCVDVCVCVSWPSVCVQFMCSSFVVAVGAHIYCTSFKVLLSEFTSLLLLLGANALVSYDCSEQNAFFFCSSIFFFLFTDPVQIEHIIVLVGSLLSIVDVGVIVVVLVCGTCNLHLSAEPAPNSRPNRARNLLVRSSGSGQYHRQTQSILRTLCDRVRPADSFQLQHQFLCYG